MMRCLLLLGLLPAFLALVACKASSKAIGYDTAVGIDPDGDYTGDDDDSSTGEIEDDFLTLPPAQTDVYVFVANPSRNTVSRINVETLEVRTTEVGVDPDIVITTPDYRSAAVFNRGDDTVSLIEASTLNVITVPIRDNLNSMRMSPDGMFVALWHDIDAEEDDDPPADGLQSFNEASFVNVITGDHWPMAVTYNPRDVVFTPDGETAAVVSDEYLSIIDLTTEPILPDLIELDPTLLDAPRAEEVILSHDAQWAFVRQLGAQDILVVDLLTHVVSRIPVGQNPTDLDLSPDGNEAVVLARGSQEIWVLDAEDPFLPAVIHGVPGGYGFGSLVFDPTGENVVLYTNAALIDRYATWNRNNDDITVRSLVKPVAGMAITPTGETMLAFHTLGDAPGADPDGPFFEEWALTMISLVDFRTNPLKLPAKPNGFSNSTNGNFGYFIMEEVPFLEVMDYTTLLHDEYELKSNPVHVGVLPDLQPNDGVEPMTWVNQDHDLGRLSFFDSDAKSLETITGFELNAGVE